MNKYQQIVKINTYHQHINKDEQISNNMNQDQHNY